MLNLRNDPIKYDGNYIRTIVAETISDIEDKIATELKKKRRKKKKDNFDEDEDDENNDYDKYNEMLNLRTDALTITCKIYYQLNSLIPSESLQEKINKLPKTITSLGNIEVSQIEKISCDKIRLVNNQNLF